MKTRNWNIYMEHQNWPSKSNRTYLYSWRMKGMILFYVLGTFYWRNWTITLNLRAYSKMMLVTGWKLGVPLKTRHYVLYNSTNCLIVVRRDVDGIIRIRLIPVCPKWSGNWVFGKPCHIVLFIIQFQKLQKVIIRLLPYSSIRYYPINSGKESPCISISIAVIVVSSNT